MKNETKYHVTCLSHEVKSAEYKKIGLILNYCDCSYCKKKETEEKEINDD
jgi:hypothetical protein